MRLPKGKGRNGPGLATSFRPTRLRAPLDGNGLGGGTARLRRVPHHAPLPAFTCGDDAPELIFIIVLILPSISASSSSQSCESMVRAWVSRMMMPQVKQIVVDEVVRGSVFLVCIAHSPRFEWTSSTIVFSSCDRNTPYGFYSVPFFLTLLDSEGVPASPL